jgi:hypothetical protein
MAHERNYLTSQDSDAVMSGDGRSGVFTLREKNHRKVRRVTVLVLAEASFELANLGATTVHVH